MTTKDLTPITTPHNAVASPVAGSAPVLVFLPLALLQAAQAASTRDPDYLNVAARAVAQALVQSLQLPDAVASQMAVTIAPNPTLMGFFTPSSSSGPTTLSPSSLSPSPVPAVDDQSATPLAAPLPPPAATVQSPNHFMAHTAHHQRVTIDNTYENLNRLRNTFYVNMKHMREDVTQADVLDFFTHICPPSLVHIHMPDRPSKFPGRKIVLVFTDKYDADAFYHQLTLRVETGELDAMFALTQADMDAWAASSPDPVEGTYKRAPLRLEVSRHTLPVPEPLVGPNARDSAEGAAACRVGKIGSWLPRKKLGDGDDGTAAPVAAKSWRRPGPAPVPSASEASNAIAPGQDSEDQDHGEAGGAEVGVWTTATRRNRRG